MKDKKKKSNHLILTLPCMFILFIFVLFGLPHAARHLQDVLQTLPSYDQHYTGNQQHHTNNHYTEQERLIQQTLAKVRAFRRWTNHRWTTRTWPWEQKKEQKLTSSSWLLYISFFFSYWNISSWNILVNFYINLDEIIQNLKRYTFHVYVT